LDRAQAPTRVSPLRRILLAVVLVVSCSSLPAQQPTAVGMRLDISPQPLESALRELAAQSGLQLLFPAAGEAAHQVAPALVGVHTPREALDQLLADTDLKYEYVNSRTVAISEKRVNWRDGYIVFEDAALGEVVAEFNRHGSRTIYIEDPALAAVRLGGNFRADNSEAFLWLLENGFGITVEQRDDRIVLK
jgi:hypothetical protein